MAREISRQLRKYANKDLQLVTTSLYKIKNTIEQSKLNKEDREKKMLKVYMN